MEGGAAAVFDAEGAGCGGAEEDSSEVEELGDDGIGWALDDVDMDGCGS